MTYSVYQAGPVDCVSEAEAKGWRGVLQYGYPKFDWINPLDHVDVADTEAVIETSEPPNPLDIIHKDLDLIEQCDALFVKYDSNVQMTGTLMEMMFAWLVVQCPIFVWNDGGKVPIWLQGIATTIDEDLDVVIKRLQQRKIINSKNES